MVASECAPVPPIHRTMIRSDEAGRVINSVTSLNISNINEQPKELLSVERRDAIIAERILNISLACYP